ncbi:MAG: helix-turn-helix domain-containing protein [Breznakia sp.]
MEEIGKKLKQKREMLGYSCKDVANATKMPIDNIRAIEQGDIHFFKDDITYLKFYIRGYCKFLGIDFDEVSPLYDEALLSFTTTLSIKETQEHEQIEKRVSLKQQQIHDQPKDVPTKEKRDIKSIRQNVKQGGSRFRKTKFDFSLVSLLTIVAVIISLVVVVFVRGVFFVDKDNKTKEDKQTEVSKKPTPETKSKTESKEESETTKKSEVSKKLSVKASTPMDYTVSGLKANESLKIEVVFTNKCWFMGQSKGVVLKGFESKVYEATTAVYEGKVLAGQQPLVFQFGNYIPGQQKVIINGEEISLSSELGKTTNVVNFNITLVGAES